jgi:hypothetical protein
LRSSKSETLALPPVLRKTPHSRLGWSTESCNSSLDPILRYDVLGIHLTISTSIVYTQLPLGSAILESQCTLFDVYGLLSDIMSSQRFTRVIYPKPQHFVSDNISSLGSQIELAFTERKDWEMRVRYSNLSWVKTLFPKNSRGLQSSFNAT